MAQFYVCTQYRELVDIKHRLEEIRDSLYFTSHTLARNRLLQPKDWEQVEAQRKEDETELDQRLPLEHEFNSRLMLLHRRLNDCKDDIVCNCYECSIHYLKCAGKSIKRKMENKIHNLPRLPDREEERF